MKKKKAILLIWMLCWWGFLFPELTFTEDSLRVVYTQDAQECEQMNSSQWEKYMDLLKAEPEQVKIKSRLLEWLGELW